ncbi:hypothetical protein OAF98_01745 [Planctomicrobium sp.]|nr:hypothetical protein [Planctomicrobium sp.]MDB4743183.1 hypothetical protein [Planctomicrobium sp.]
MTVSRKTKNGERAHPWHSSVTGEAAFTASYTTCYFEGCRYTKIRGGELGGNYQDEEGDIYRITQH